MRPWIKHLWPDSLAGRSLAILLGITLLLIIGSALLLQEERHTRFEEQSRFRLLANISEIVDLLEDASPGERQRIAARLSKDPLHIRIDDTPAIIGPPRQRMEHFLARRLSERLDKPMRHINIRALRDGLYGREHHEEDDDEDEHEEYQEREHDRPHRQDTEGLLFSIRLQDGQWLNIRVDHFEAPPPWAHKTLGLLLLLLLILIASGVFLSWRLSRPMAQLAEAAERFGLGENIQPLDEKGPREIRHTINAFNRMQQRLQKHLKDRTLMLAAVSHDLRTPITTLRLRAEYIDDEEMRNKTLATLDEMEAILSATLGFARDDAADEQSRATDIAALLQSLVDDHADLGGDISYHGPDKLTTRCRPVALRRALSNLMDNALKYGSRAEVSLKEIKEGLEITIDDNGPGIPADQLEEVFTPFYRLEESRSRDSGGIGLGLAVARTIAHAHGGELTLHNLENGGLCAKLVLPR